MSVQEYLLAELVRSATLRSPAELVANVAQRQRAEGCATVSSAESIRNLRNNY